MAEMTHNINLNQVAILLSRYKFEMKGHNPQDLLEQWLPLYPVRWIRLAIVEALYQGRYKVISVEQILSLWLRRGHPTFHFNHEFERMICNNMLCSVIKTPSSAAKQRLNQTALPSFYQREHLIEETATEESTELLTESKELIETEEILTLDDLLEPDEDPTLLENPPTNKLTDVKELFAQLISQNTSSETVISENLVESTNGKAERGTMYGHSIHEFTPNIDHSTLYSKLKAVLQRSL